MRLLSKRLQIGESSLVIGSVVQLGEQVATVAEQFAISVQVVRAAERFVALGDYGYGIFTQTGGTYELSPYVPATLNKATQLCLGGWTMLRRRRMCRTAA